MRYRGVKYVAQDHTVSKWKNWGFSPGLTPKYVHLTTFLLFLSSYDHFPFSLSYPTIPHFSHFFWSLTILSLSCIHTHTDGLHQNKYRGHTGSGSTEEHRAEGHKAEIGTVLTKNMDRVLRL